MAAAIAQQLIDLNAAPEAFDPADLDGGFDDNTVARKRRKTTKAINLDHAGRQAPKGKKLLQMRQKMPELDEYAGKSVSRKQVFGDGDAESDSEQGTLEDNNRRDADDDDDDCEDSGDDDTLGPPPVADLGNFSISDDLEQEYDKFMKKSQNELSLLRKPSASEIAKKDAEAKHLKQQMGAWSALVEFRIHLESALSIAHRLPAGNTFAAIRDSGDAVLSRELDAVAGDAQQFLGILLDLQVNVAQQRGISTSIVEEALNKPKKQPCPEADSWALVDAQLQSVMDWGLGIADEWKERTRLDTRRSFKVLDQSLSSQMRAASEVEPEKLRRRCTPPPGRHKVFGVPAEAAASSSANDGAASHRSIEEERDIFDDRDFYVQLLREALTSGDKNVADQTEESRELQMELQGRRASKKRSRDAVERRASKGRKIRYVPIEKLQNFLAPRARSSLTSTSSVDPAMADHAVDALLRSLFSSAKGV